jgi:N-acetylglucosamine-6-sulfatase
MLTRRSFLAGSAAPLLAAPAGPKRPNIVFVLMDDLRWDALGIAGHPFVKTPNIDRIGREGAHFLNNFTTTPLCSPSRASFLTGQYVHTHGVIDNTNHNELSHKLVTSAVHLQKAGYETAYMGKWHMGTDSSPRPGWNRWISFRGQGAYDDPLLNIDGKEEKVPGYVTDIFTKNALDFIRAEHSKPFLLYVAHKAVHGPFIPAARHKELFANEPIHRPASAQDTLEGKPMLQRKVNDLPPLKPGMGSSDDLIRNQMRCLTAVEEGVGQMLQTLEETKQLDNTVFMFCSDNGYIWGEHRLGDKRPAYEESIRIPLLVRYPSMVKAGTKIRQLTLNIDMAPTLLDFAGLPTPKEMQGRTLMPLLQGKSPKWRESFFAEYFEEVSNPRIATWQAVRTEHWKYIHYPYLPGMDELYDVKEDKLEMKNRVNDPAAQGALKQAKAEFEKVRKASGTAELQKK